MELKKSQKANLEKNRLLYMEVGLLVALLFTLLAFEWQTAPKVEVEETGTVVQTSMEEDIVPITRQEEAAPPPPEPPKVTDILDIVSDDVHVDTNIDINIEADLNTEIVAPVIAFTGTEVVEEEEEVVMFAIVEDKPMFNGKDAETGFREYVRNNTQYPPVAQENGITGRIFVEFTIGTDGTVTDVKLLRGVDPLLDNEALRVIRASPKWTPGMQRGKPVKVKYQFPVNFQLNN
jgi:protein TonB